MELSVKIAALTKEDTLVELSKMLDKITRIQIGWTGARIVSVQGYSGTVDINVIVKKFLNACPRRNEYDLTKRKENIWKGSTRVYGTKDSS